ncbi:MAG TPA: ABC transporter permease [Solirubrobacterales bacterium]|nr:ABC transporter permease [Solirubrobacterales bacterium]
MRRLILGILGCGLLLGVWYLAVDVLALGRFGSLPPLAEVLTEWTSHEPAYGTSLFTHNYYADIWISVRRVLEAFVLAVVLGVPLGLAIGWSRRFRELTFPVLELIRPIPILAWVPLAILMFPRGEQPVIFLTFLSAFFVMTLNTLLGVQSVDRDLVRAARSLGASPRDVLRTVIMPGALPYVTTGMKIAIGVSWFSLVAGEMVAGQSGLGYLINSSYATVRYPTIVIGMLTLGIVGFATSAAIGALTGRLAPHRTRAAAA